MAHLTDEQNERLREAMQSIISERFGGVRKRLAQAMGVAAPSLSDFLRRKGGASQETADLFAERIMKKPTAEIIGKRILTRPFQPKPGVGAPISPEVRRRATILLKQKPQEFDQEAIDVGFDCVVIRNAEDAQNASVVAEFVRIAILGSAGKLPKAPPPPGTRRARSRAG